MKFRNNSFLLLLCTICLSSCSGSDSPVTADREEENSHCLQITVDGVNAEIELRREFSEISLNQPVAMIQAPGIDGRWFVAEREGTIRSFAANESLKVVADISAQVGSQGQEQGLLGIAFHPNYPVVKALFVSYTGLDGTSVVSRFSLSAEGVLVSNSEQIVLTQSQPFTNHNGGGIAFGPDGYLYIGFGDGGSAGDPQNNAQNTRNWLGAMLRIDVRQSPYVVPEDNPFAASPTCGESSACSEIWAWGLRNPWRWSFDSETGKLWAGDVGQNDWEEISVLEAGSNHGWRCFEGSHAFNLNGCGSRSGYQFPVAEYSHQDGLSVTGGYVYRGQNIPLLKGRYLYADFLTGHIWGLDVEKPNDPPIRLIDSSGLNIASFAQSLEHELFVVDFNGGIYALDSCQ